MLTAAFSPKPRDVVQLKTCPTHADQDTPVNGNCQNCRECEGLNAVFIKQISAAAQPNNSLALLRVLATKQCIRIHYGGIEASPAPFISDIDTARAARAARRAAFSCSTTTRKEDGGFLVVVHAGFSRWGTIYWLR
jgi:hypothetical protein